MRRTRAAIAAVAIAGFALPASAATVSVTLNLKDGSANGTLVACNIRHHYTFFHVAAPLHMDGSVQPAPHGRWRVKVKVKKCIRGRFRRVWAGHTRGKADGTFAITYVPHHAGAFFARAYFYGVRPAVRSDKHFFRVR